MADDWFRDPTWDLAAQNEFERRLSRARAHSRPQYLRIKAMCIADAGHISDARLLLERVLVLGTTFVDTAYAAELLGDLDRRCGDLDSALKHYRRSLDDSPDMNATTGELHISIAAVLVEQGLHTEAIDELHLHPQTSQLNVSVCRWNMVMAMAKQAAGDLDGAQAAARQAIALLDEPDQFSRHPGVGRAALDDLQRARMERIVEGKRPYRPRRWSR